MGLMDLILPGKTKFGVATNILLAEYNFRRLPPEMLWGAFQDISEKFIRGFGHESTVDALNYYLEQPRNIQLNTLALAFNATGVGPLLNNEFWTVVKNPFHPNIYCQSSMKAVQSRIRKVHGVEIVIAQTSISESELDEIAEAVFSEKPG